MSQVCSVLSVRDCVGLKDIEMLVGAEKSNIPVGIPISGAFLAFRTEKNEGGGQLKYTSP